MPGNCYRIDSSDTCYNTSGHYSIFCFSEDGVDYSDQFTECRRKTPCFSNGECQIMIIRKFNKYRKEIL